MCGILGTLFPVHESQFAIALDELRHRGPDGSGIASLDGVTLGHRRLAIIDLSPTGAQPMTDMTNRFTIVFNGELYNYLEIRRELETVGHTFRGHSDTEVFLEAYKRWGERCLDRFNGMWAAAIWDAAERSLFLTRDRFGKKPLFFCSTREGLVFASEMKAIYPFLREIRPSKLIPGVFEKPFSYESGVDTIISGVQRFPAGCYALVTPEGNITPKQFYALADRIHPSTRTYGAAVEEFRELFFDAVSLRMRSDVPLGTALSGGLDSSAVFSCIATLGHQQTHRTAAWQNAFCARFPGTPIDETEYALQVTDSHGVQLSQVEIDPLEHFDQLDYYLYLVEEPYLTSPIPMVLTYKAMRDAGVVVTMDGHGADELFCGYGRSIFEAFPDATFAEQMEVAKIYSDQIANSVDGQFSRPTPLWELLRYGAVRIARQCTGRNGHPEDLPEWLDSLSSHLYQLFTVSVLPTLLRNYDRYSMINGVEVRMPFLDHRIVEFVFSLPWQYKLGKGFTKRLLRDAMAPNLPPRVCWRKTKIGFNSPILDWLRGPLREWAFAMIKSTAFRVDSLVDVEKTEHLMEKAMNKKATWTDGERLWGQLQRHLWGQSLRHAKRFDQ